jgi:hypothetical protein
MKGYCRLHNYTTTIFVINKNISFIQKTLDKKEAMDQYIAAVPMNLPKAFDCLPHDILLDKLSAHGVSH